MILSINHRRSVGALRGLVKLDILETDEESSVHGSTDSLLVSDLRAFSAGCSLTFYNALESPDAQETLGFNPLGLSWAMACPQFQGAAW